MKIGFTALTLQSIWMLLFLVSSERNPNEPFNPIQNEG